MATIPEQIVEDFICRLRSSGAFTEGTLKSLQDILAGDKKVKAQDLVTVLSENPREHLS